jgi:dipeptidyl aminopeptidase/acylaminoacyl peptidase
MTSWLIGHHHDWCAAVPGALVVDFAGYYDQSDTGIWIDSLLGSPHLPQNARKYLEQSPATYLDQATTPTLIMQNVGDNNAPVAQAYGLYHALRDRGIKTKFVIFGIDGHGPGDPYHERQAVVRTLAWINENCGPGNT